MRNLRVLLLDHQLHFQVNLRVTLAVVTEESTAVVLLFPHENHAFCDRLLSHFIHKLRTLSRKRSRALLILIIPYLATELSVLFSQEQVGYSLQVAPEPVLGHFLLDNRATAAGLSPVVGKVQEVEGLLAQRLEDLEAAEVSLGVLVRRLPKTLLTRGGESESRAASSATGRWILKNQNHQVSSMFTDTVVPPTPPIPYRLLKMAKPYA